MNDNLGRIYTTNRDKINEMTNSQIARILHLCPKNHVCNDYKDCQECREKWLQEPRED